MNVPTSILAFSFAAALATLTPGLDTALVLRTAAIDGKRHAMMAALGIGTGVLGWGTATALGLAELLNASALAYEIVRWAGAVYLMYLGARMLLRPRKEFGTSTTSVGDAARLSIAESFRRGLLTNLLNPKVGVFYVSFLPQFIPHDASNPRALMLLFALIHAVEGIVWFSILTIATGRIAPLLRRGRVVKFFDQAMGTLFIAFGVKLALERRA